MSNSRWIILAALISTSSFAGVSFQQKEMRVQALMKLKFHAPSLAFEAYQRELEYETHELSVDSRAKNETNLLADKIRQQVYLAYKAALAQNKSPIVAREEVKSNIEKDLDLAAPGLKNELINLALQTLDSIDAGGSSEEVDLTNVEVWSTSTGALAIRLTRSKSSARKASHSVTTNTASAPSIAA